MIALQQGQDQSMPYGIGKNAHESLKVLIYQNCTVACVDPSLPQIAIKLGPNTLSKTPPGGPYPYGLVIKGASLDHAISDYHEYYHLSLLCRAQAGLPRRIYQLAKMTSGNVRLWLACLISPYVVTFWMFKMCIKHPWMFRPQFTKYQFKLIIKQYMCGTWI